MDEYLNIWYKKRERHIERETERERERERERQRQSERRRERERERERTRDTEAAHAISFAMAAMAAHAISFAIMFSLQASGPACLCSMSLRDKRQETPERPETRDQRSETRDQFQCVCFFSSGSMCSIRICHVHLRELLMILIIVYLDS